MKALVALGALGALLIPTVSMAVQACPDRAPNAITSVAPDSVKCQKTMAKELSKYAKTKMKELSKCRLKEPSGTCPTAKVTEKNEKAALKTKEKITKACGADSVQAGLTSSYAGSADDTLISECALSQYAVDTEVLVGHFTGIATEDPFQEKPKERAKCVKDLSKLGQKYVLGQLKTVSKCIDKAMKDQVGGNLADLCVGQYSGAVFIPPTDVKTAEKLDKLTVKTEEKIDKSCELTSTGQFDPTFGFIRSVFACSGASTEADLQDCLICRGWDGVLNLLDAAYAEDHDAVVVAGAANAIQDAVTAATAGDKIFVRSGTYDEDPNSPAVDGNGVNIPIGKDDLSLIGCGAATNDRPFLPAANLEYDNGMNAVSVDGLTFQSLRFEGWDDNAIFVSTANGVTFRDIVDNGLEETRYAVFPILSTGILVEACTVEREDDAPIYVGQSNGFEIRFNDIRRGVAAIEFENSVNGFGHNNYITENTGGVLVFKDPNLVDQSGDHQVLNNVIESNSTDNFGSGFVAVVPRGTGIMIVSNDNSLFESNIIRDNDSFGVLAIDQAAANTLVDPDPFPVLSGDPDSFNNLIRRNHVLLNAQDPDDVPVFADIAMAFGTDSGNQENCQTANIGSDGVLFSTAFPFGNDQNDCDATP